MTLRRLHYAWAVTAVTFLALLAASAVRAAPGVILVPLETEFGWDRAIISLAVSISLITFGLGGPIGGTLVDRIGPRRALLAGLGAIAAGLFFLLSLRDLWQLFLIWGLLIGIGTGITSQVTGALPSRTAGSGRTAVWSSASSGQPRRSVSSSSYPR